MPRIARDTTVTQWGGFQIDPNVDYGRYLTAAGGVLIAFKDIDLRLRHTLWRLLLWMIATGPEALYLLRDPPMRVIWLDIGCLIAVAIINWLIVARPVEIYRSLEVRRDCIIIDEAEVFWLQHMGADGLAFQPDQQGNQMLCGIYGTRFIEYLTVRRFDELDRTPEVFAAHLQEALTQLWDGPS